MHTSPTSFVCHEMSQINEYAKMDDAAFKLMKKIFPDHLLFIAREQSVLSCLRTKRKLAYVYQTTILL